MKDEIRKILNKEGHESKESKKSIVENSLQRGLNKIVNEQVDVEPGPFGEKEVEEGEDFDPDILSKEIDFEPEEEKKEEVTEEITEEAVEEKPPIQQLLDQVTSVSTSIKTSINDLIAGKPKDEIIGTLTTAKNSLNKIENDIADILTEKEEEGIDVTSE